MLVYFHLNIEYVNCLRDIHDFEFSEKVTGPASPPHFYMIFQQIYFSWYIFLNDDYYLVDITS